MRNETPQTELARPWEGQLYTPKDVLDVFPSISPQILHHRIKRGYIRLEHESRGPGRPNLFWFEELVHCGVIDELSALGLLNNPAGVRTVVRDLASELLADGYQGEQRSVELEEAISVDHDVEQKYQEDPDQPNPLIDLTLEDPWGLKPSFYVRHGFRVLVSIDLTRRHEDQRVDREYWVRYVPEIYCGSVVTGELHDRPSKAQLSWVRLLEESLKSYGESVPSTESQDRDIAADAFREILDKTVEQIANFSFAAVSVREVFSAAYQQLFGKAPPS